MPYIRVFVPIDKNAYIPPILFESKKKRASFELALFALLILGSGRRRGRRGISGREELCFNCGSEVIHADTINRGHELIAEIDTVVTAGNTDDFT